MRSRMARRVALLLCLAVLAVWTSVPGDSASAVAASQAEGARRAPWVRPPSAKKVEPPRAYGEKPEQSDVLAASYYDTRGTWESRLTLNNKGADAMSPRVTLYARDGRAFTVPGVTVPGDDFLELDLNTITRQAPGPFQQGSVEVVYHGKELE